MKYEEVDKIQEVIKLNTYKCILEDMNTKVERDEKYESELGQKGRITQVTNIINTIHNEYYCFF